MTANPASIFANPTAPDFPSLLGMDWWRLLPEVRRRFSPQNCSRSVVYKEIMHKVEMNIAGRILGYVCRLLGTPLSYRTGSMVPTEVRVYPNLKLGGMTWDRLYFFAPHKCNRVRSTKCILAEEGLIEVAVSGVGMYSRVYEKRGAPVFESQGFFCTLGRRRFTMPSFFSLGKIIATQKALSKETFLFTLTVNHPFFGAMFRQAGIFREIS